MRKLLHALLAYSSLTCLALTLAGCFGAQTPEEAATDFWDAVIANDRDAVVDTSTLTDPNDFDGFEQNWNGYQPEWGKIVIEGREARIDTTLSNADGDDRDVTTWLVQQDDEWLVDYPRTARSARGGLFGNLLNRVSDISQELGNRFSRSAEETNQKLDQLLQELEENQETFSQQADDALSTYSAQLEQSLQAMDKSIQQALDEQATRLSKAEKETLQAASKELEMRLESLDPESIESALENSKALAEIRDSLEQLDADKLEKQKKEWQALSESLTEKVEEFRKAMRQ